MKTVNYSNIILMKVGPYCGYGLERIIDIKQEEEKNIGKFFWGYSGVFCRPLVVKNLLFNSKEQKVKILFIETKSDFVPDTVERFRFYSEDGSLWKSLPKDVLLVGNSQKPHFAITGMNLKRVNFKIDLSEYCTLKGVFTNENQRFDKYFKYRVDKACGVYIPNDEKKKDEVDIKYESELVEPYAVYVK